jgi:hypothetical protein
MSNPSSEQLKPTKLLPSLITSSMIYFSKLLFSNGGELSGIWIEVAVQFALK